MVSDKKRPHQPDYAHNTKKQRPSSSSSSAITNLNNSVPDQKVGKVPSFVSYLEIPDLPPKIKLLCETIANAPSATVESVLDETGVRVNQEDVEEVLKLSYQFPSSAIKFFRWSGQQLNDQHSPYAWNLVVDLLGKNSHFDSMWEAIKSMLKEGLISLATLASVFSSYVVANRPQEAIRTFEVMDLYGCRRDIVALNSLLSAICRDGNTKDAYDFFCIAIDDISPDPDSYAILLEGWEREGNVNCARRTFSEMVMEIGWDPENVPAYDSFLSTLLKGPDGLHEALKFFDTLKDRRCYPSMKFFNEAFDKCVKKTDVRGASFLWKIMIERVGHQADLQMYNSMISLYCMDKKEDLAKRLLDEMVYHGVFPDSETYNFLFQFWIKNGKLKDATVFFNEMIKNEFVPSLANCNAGIKAFLDDGDAYMAIKVWKYMIENHQSNWEETGNMLILGLRDQNKVHEAVKYAEDMIRRGIKLKISTLSKLKEALVKLRKGYLYDELLKKWKSHGGLYSRKKR